MQTEKRSIDTRETVDTALRGVFQDMLAVEFATDEGTTPLFSDGAPRIIGTVGFGGDEVNGALFLHVSDTLAKKITSALLGLSEAECQDADTNDAIGEITNMLAGSLKSRLCDNGLPCAMSTPSIIRSGACHVEAMPSVRQETFYFHSGPERFAVEVHMKFTQA